MTPRRFWMVKGEGPARFCHMSLAEAETEADRLAREHPGQTFAVLEAVSAHRRRDVERTDLRCRATDDDEDLPF
jgi:hypothetical protein